MTPPDFDHRNYYAAGNFSVRRSCAARRNKPGYRQMIDSAGRVDCSPDPAASRRKEKTAQSSIAGPNFERRHMSISSLVGWYAVLIIARWSAQLWLERLNQRSALEHATAVPDAFRKSIDPAACAKSVKYTLAKSQLSQIEETCDAIIAHRAFGILPWAFILCDAVGTQLRRWRGCFFDGAVAGFARLPSTALAVSFEERLASTSNAKTLVDRSAQRIAACHSARLSFADPVLKLVEWTGARWWLGVGALLPTLVNGAAPILIMPRFNKFTPCRKGFCGRLRLSLNERGSRHGHSSHGRKQTVAAFKRVLHRLRPFRKIVLFDTLVQQLTAQNWKRCWRTKSDDTRKAHSQNAGPRQPARCRIYAVRTGETRLVYPRLV